LWFDTSLTGDKILEHRGGHLLGARIWRVFCVGRHTVLEFREVVINFLKEHPAYVCAECLASSLGVPLHPTTMITLGLHRAGGFESVDDVCSRCHRRIRVIKAETSG
jgi:hypothetical protein